MCSIVVVVCSIVVVVLTLFVVLLFLWLLDPWFIPVLVSTGNAISDILYSLTLASIWFPDLCLVLRA